MNMELVIPEQGNALPDTLDALEARFAIATKQRELLEDYIMQRLKPNKHFYTVGDGQKPSLTKDGAELICLPHGYKPQYAIEAGPDQPPQDDATAYQITVKCRLVRGQEFAGEGLGSASSMITKRDGDRVVRQTDIGLRHNATLKMAQKSAYIAATLNSTAASEFFTQDIEDILASGGAQVPSSDEVLCPEDGKPMKMQSWGKWSHPTGKKYKAKDGKMKTAYHSYTPEELEAAQPPPPVQDDIQDAPTATEEPEPEESPTSDHTQAAMDIEQDNIADLDKLMSWAEDKYNLGQVEVAAIVGVEFLNQITDFKAAQYAIIASQG